MMWIQALFTQIIFGKQNNSNRQPYATIFTWVFSPSLIHCFYKFQILGAHMGHDYVTKEKGVILFQPPYNCCFESNS